MSENAVQTAPGPAPKPPLKTGGKIDAIVPQDLDEAWRLSMALVRAGMVPKSYEGRTDEETCSKVMIGIMKSMEVGLKPITGLSTIMIVNQRPCIWGDGAVALVQNSGKLEWMKETFEGTPGKADWTARCQMKRLGHSEIYERTFSHADAERAKLLGKPGPWMAYPQRMLQMRARAWTIRDGFSDVLSGLGIVEEVQDIPADDPKPVDIGFLDDAPAKPGQLTDGTAEVAMAQEDMQAAPAQPVAVASVKEPCTRCGDKGTIAFRHGDQEGLEPCPDCAGPR